MVKRDTESANLPEKNKEKKYALVCRKQNCIIVNFLLAWTKNLTPTTERESGLS